MIHWAKTSLSPLLDKWWLTTPLWRSVMVALMSLVMSIGSLLSLSFYTGSLVESKGGLVDQTIVSELLSYVDDWRSDSDPLVNLPSGAQAKSSNVYGVEIGGVRYFYQLTHHVSFDPWRLGKPGDYEVMLVMNKGTQDELIVYRAR